MPLADTLKKEPGDILKSDDWNVIIKEIDRLETAKINRDGADTLKGPLTIAEALNANSNVTIKGSLSIVVPQPQEPSGQILVLGPTNASNLRLGYHQDYSWIQSHGSKPLLINRLGNNIGIGSTINPVARLDIASATRTGTHPTAVKGLYITGDFNADNDGVEFRHSNGTQGIGFGFNTIYATGSHPNQDLQLKPKGTGVIAVSGDLSVTGSVTPSVGNSENNGIMFPKDPGGGGGDAAWIRYYVRGGEATTFEIGTSNDSDDHIALMPNAGNVGIGTSTPNDKLDVAGSLRILTGSNPIRFTSVWSAFPDAVTNQAEICNDTTYYKTLMIIGNKSANLGRRVSIWDRLEVNGQLEVKGNGNTFRISVEGNRVVFYLSNAFHGTNKQISWDGDNNWDPVP